VLLLVMGPLCGGQEDFGRAVHEPLTISCIRTASRKNNSNRFSVVLQFLHLWLHSGLF
jgi:hypothetical protein